MAHLQDVNELMKIDLHKDEASTPGIHVIRKSNVRSTETSPKRGINASRESSPLPQRRSSPPLNHEPSSLKRRNSPTRTYVPRETSTTPSRSDGSRESRSEHSDEDVPPRRRRPLRSQTRQTKRRRHNHSPSSFSSKEEADYHGKSRQDVRRRRRESPSPLPSSSHSNSTSGTSYEPKRSSRRGHRHSHAAWKRSRKMQTLKEGAKSVTFLTFDGSYGNTDKVLHFIQQFDAAFGGENFIETSKLRHIAMYLQKTPRHWWASLKGQGMAPRTWKSCRLAIMQQFLDDSAPDDVLTAWRSPTLERGETIQKFVDKFWGLHLKATVFKRIDFSKQKQQFCAGLPEDMRAYVNAQKPKTITQVIPHAMIAYKIFSPNAKVPNKPSNRGEAPQGGEKNKVESKAKNSNERNQDNNNSNKKKEKGVYKGNNKLSPQELEQYRKDHRCFKCGETGHSYRDCPTKKQPKKDTPQATEVIAQGSEGHQGASLCFAWGKVRDQDAFMLFDPGSTHNYISQDLTSKLGIHSLEMGPKEDADGAFEGQEVPITPLIGKLRIHVQGYSDQEDFYVSPLKHVDVLLGSPWFTRMPAILQFPNRVITFQHRDREVVIHANDKGNTIPIVSHKSLKKTIKKSLFSYMIYVKDSKIDFNQQVSSFPISNSSQEEQEALKAFLNEYALIFTDSIPDELPSSRGEDDHKIDLIPGSSPPNKPPYRVSYAQQEEIMAQVNELMEKEMIQPSSSPFCSPVLLVQKKDGSYREGTSQQPMLLQQPNVARPPPRGVEGVPPLPDPDVSVIEVTQSKEDDIEANGIKRGREKEAIKSFDEIFLKYYRLEYNGYSWMLSGALNGFCVAESTTQADAMVE
ncbi:hypothetical protein L7F22_005087 [Adiantum nelumboides]|nr:hypothetical protein [Adiantum nelumboides]